MVLLTSLRMQRKSWKGCHKVASRNVSNTFTVADRSAKLHKGIFCRYCSLNDCTVSYFSEKVILGTHWSYYVYSVWVCFVCVFLYTHSYTCIENEWFLLSKLVVATWPRLFWILNIIYSYLSKIKNIKLFIVFARARFSSYSAPDNSSTYELSLKYF